MTGFECKRLSGLFCSKEKTHFQPASEPSEQGTTLANAGRGSSRYILYENIIYIRAFRIGMCIVNVYFAFYL